MNQPALNDAEPRIDTTYFSQMENPVDADTLKELHEIYDKVNAYHTKNDTPGFNELNMVKSLKTFAF